jgi:hypothetical protein
VRGTIIIFSVLSVELISSTLNNVRQRLVIRGVDHISRDRDFNAGDNSFQLLLALCCGQLSQKILEMSAMNPLMKT